MPTLCEIMGMEPPEDPLTLAALELQAALIARARVGVTLADWAGFAPIERLILADAFDEQAINMAVVHGSAARSAEGAAVAFSTVDGGASLVRLRLAEMAEDALARGLAA